jgi:hypothetical protein
MGHRVGARRDHGRAGRLTRRLQPIDRMGRPSGRLVRVPGESAGRWRSPERIFRLLLYLGLRHV